MKRTVLALVTVLCALAVRPLVAQQATSSAPAVTASTAPVSTARPGPRLQPEWRRFEPSVRDSSTSAQSSLRRNGGGETIVVSTLALVLIVIIIVLLVAK